MNELAWLTPETFDIRHMTFREFVLLLYLEDPWSDYLDHLPSDECQLRRLRIGWDLGLTPVNRVEFYTSIAYNYGQTPTALNLTWIRLHDVTLGEVHQRLWREANLRGDHEDFRSYDVYN